MTGNKIIRHLSKYALVTLSILIFLLSVCLIVYTSYLFGHRVLEGGMLGGDTPYHLGLMSALNRYFPKIPLWFPFAGAGSSLILGYWAFSYYLAIAGSHINGMSLEQWVRLLEFLTVPIVGIELYIFCYIKFKNHLIALIAGLMYPLSSMAWGWISLAGFFSMQMSSVFYVPALLFFDLYLEGELVGGNTTKKRLCLLGFFLTLSIASLTHLSFIPNFYLILPIYAVIRSQFAPRLKESRLISFLRSVKVLLILLPLGVIAGAFILYPQSKYFALQPYTPTYGPTDTPFVPWKAFIGLERPNANVGSFYTPLFMSLLVSFFALVGGIIGLVKRDKITALFTVILFSIFIISESRYLAINFAFMRVFVLPVATRLTTGTAIYMTILAAWGMWNLADIPSSIIRLIKNALVGKISFLVSSIIVVILAIYSFYFFRDKQTYPPVTVNSIFLFGYGGYGTMGLNVPYCIVPGWEKILPDEGTCQDYKPRGQIDDIKADFWDDKLVEEISGLKMDKMTRVSISPYLGPLTFSFTKHTEASMVSAPSGQSIINIDWLGIHDKALFLKGNTKPSEVSEVAKWFGTDYVFLHKQADALDRYENEGWEKVLDYEALQIMKNKNSAGIINISDKPAVLVIGSKKDPSYEIFLQTVFKGVIGYDKGLIFEGSENIDDYNLSELSKFTLLILNGYKYKNKDKAWNLLNSYVKDGGNLFIDTGWQYVSPDWGKGPDSSGKYLPVEFSEPFPIKNSVWDADKNTWADAKIISKIEDIDLVKFGDLSYSDKPWGISVATKDTLRSWAEPVLTIGDNVVVARGSYGKGKVVWSGMNIFSHVFDKSSDEEYRFLNILLTDLLPEKQIQKGEYSVSWNNPDKLIIDLKSVPVDSYLYLAESYAPYWKAILFSEGKQTPLVIYKTGPRFMSVKLPDIPTGSKLVFRFSMTKEFGVGFLLSFSTLSVIVLMILDSLIFKSKFEQVTRGIVLKGSLKSSGRMKRISSKEEEDY